MFQQAQELALFADAVVQWLMLLDQFSQLYLESNYRKQI